MREGSGEARAPARVFGILNILGHGSTRAKLSPNSIERTSPAQRPALPALPGTQNPFGHDLADIEGINRLGLIAQLGKDLPIVLAQCR